MSTNLRNAKVTNCLTKLGKHRDWAKKETKFDPAFWEPLGLGSRGSPDHTSDTPTPD